VNVKLIISHKGKT